jgi:hypothetical protein
MQIAEQDPLLCPAWVQKAIEQWLDSTRDQPVSLADFAIYLGAVIGRPITGVPGVPLTDSTLEAEIDARDILQWMPSAMSDSMGDLLEDLKKGRTS